MKKYFTTPIYYVNDKPHIGHAFTTICADYLARFYRSLGQEVYFLTGTDEHGKKISDAALKAKISEKEFVDSIVIHFKDALKIVNASNNNFIRTTDKKHEKYVQEVFQKLYDQGDLYKGTYSGKYCVGCERYYGEDELIDGCCPDHKTKAIDMEEETYFFKLSKYENQLKKLFESDFIYPKKFKNEILTRINLGLKDVSVSRTNFSWGIELPFDKKHVVYVWFDALLNYLSGLEDKNYWPATHLLGKDILWFHIVYWPAILFALNKEIPKFFVHGWWTVEGQKMSKSLGNVVSIDTLSKYGIDVTRYYLIKQMPCGEDADFNTNYFEERYLELANNLGNLINRVAIISQKNDVDFSKKYDLDKEILENIATTIKKVSDTLEAFKLQESLNEIMAYSQFLNKYINDFEPWKLIKEDKERASQVLFNLIQGINILTLLLEPCMPSKMYDARNIFGFKSKTLFEAYIKNKSLKIEKPFKIEPKILFPKIEKFEF